MLWIVVLQRTAGKRFSTAEHIKKIALAKDAHWEEFLTRQFSVPVKPNEHQETHHVMVRLVDDPKHQFLAAVANNFAAKDWIFVCRANIVTGVSRTWWEQYLFYMVPAHFIVVMVICYFLP